MARADDGALGPCEMANQVAAGTQVCQVVSLDTEITPAAGEACRDYGLAPADAIIVATSRAQAATLLTCDKHLKAVLGLTLVTNAKI